MILSRFEIYLLDPHLLSALLLYRVGRHPLAYPITNTPFSTNQTNEQTVKRITSNLLLLLAAVLVMAASCLKKDPVPAPVPDTDKKAQISKTWRVTSLLVNNSPAQGVDLDRYSFEFETDGTYDITAGSLTGTGKWQLNSNEQKLVLDKGADHEKTATILSLTDSKLELEFTEPADGKAGEQKILFKLKQ